MRRKGLAVAASFFFQGDVNTNWPASLIAELKTVPASAFRAVDESGCVAPDSAQFAYRPTCPAP
jgi:hypothetical protein